MSKLTRHAASGTITVEESKCKGCEICVSACPEDVLAMTPEIGKYGYAVALLVDSVGCTGCSICARVCPDAAIEVFLRLTE